MSKKIQRYEGRAITVSFDPGRCIHAGNCVRGLPKVFRAGAKGSWIHPDEASPDALAVLIRTCPSGALTFQRKDGGPEEAKPAVNSITIVENGQLDLHAEMTINGRPEPCYRASLCRCGASKNKPYCDNTHKQIGFTDASRPLQSPLQAVPVDGCLEITALPDGPLLIKGGFEIHDAKGKQIFRADQAALCRCGASGNKPFCDGSHQRIGFKSGEEAA